MVAAPGSTAQVQATVIHGGQSCTYQRANHNFRLTDLLILRYLETFILSKSYDALQSLGT